jgi:hypothetical protein
MKCKWLRRELVDVQVPDGPKTFYSSLYVETQRAQKKAHFLLKREPRPGPLVTLNWDEVLNAWGISAGSGFTVFYYYFFPCPGRTPVPYQFLANHEDLQGFKHPRGLIGMTASPTPRASM